MCDQIDAHILADKRALNATSADGNIGGLIVVEVGRLLKMENNENVNNFKSSLSFRRSLLSPEAGACSTSRRLDAVLSLLHFDIEIQTLVQLRKLRKRIFSLELCREDGNYFTFSLFTF